MLIENKSDIDDRLSSLGRSCGKRPRGKNERRFLVLKNYFFLSDFDDALLMMMMMARLNPDDDDDDDDD